MATTPRPYLWQFSTLRASSVDNTGGAIHYFSEDAQSLYLKNGIQTKLLTVDDGHWESAEAGAAQQVTNDGYDSLTVTHPATGNVYATAILPDTDDTLYLLRYCYVKDISKFASNIEYMMQADNAIAQLTATIQNYKEPVFTKPTTLFMPGAKMNLGLYMGDSGRCEIGQAYLDEVNFGYNRKSMSISGRNNIGYLLNDQTFDQDITFTDSASDIVESILQYFGVEKYWIETKTTVVELKCKASDTGLKALQTLADILSDPLADNKTWDIEETPDGHVVVGYNDWRWVYIHKDKFQFSGQSDLLKRTSVKAIDGAYSKVYCTGKTSGGADLTPVVKNVNTFAYWALGAHKTYFAPTLEAVTQTQLQTYAEQLAKQLKYTGITESYEMTIRPQLVVGDVADLQIDESVESIGTVTQVTHILGERGFKTAFTVSSGGDATTSEGRLYTNVRRNKGNNRKKRITDFIK